MGRKKPPNVDFNVLKDTTAPISNYQHFLRRATAETILSQVPALIFPYFRVEYCISRYLLDTTSQVKKFNKIYLGCPSVVFLFSFALAREQCHVGTQSR